jgi:hypothetical protein
MKNTNIDKILENSFIILIKNISYHHNLVKIYLMDELKLLNFKIK